MENRKNRQEIALNTLEILEQGSYTNKKGEQVSIKEQQTFAEENTTVYSPETSDKLLKHELSPLFTKPAEINVNSKTTLDAVRDIISHGHTDVVCLNFASAKNPGGGFLGGSQAQEESIARATGLYPCLLKALPYYETNRRFKSCFYTDYMIYSPAVPILKDENGSVLETPVQTGIITAPAVNAGVVRKREPEKLDDIGPVMKRRISKVLRIALLHEHTSIVLGAWGCGVFGNDPDEVAQYFNDVIEAEYMYSFRQITFAIYTQNDRFIKPFTQAFGRQF